MPTWTDTGGTLPPEKLEELMRDACAMLGKCQANDSPKQVLTKSPNDLLFDDPPLPDRPNHQKEALVYLIVYLLDQANIYISPKTLPRGYFNNKATKPLEDAVEAIGEAQQYPAHEE